MRVIRHENLQPDLDDHRDHIATSGCAFFHDSRNTAMLYKGDRFAPSGVAEYFKLIFTTLGAGAQIGLNISLSVLIGSHFRYHAPWAFYLAIALACAWTLSLFLLITSLSRLVRFLNRSRDALKSSRSSLILPLGAESLAAAVGSALLSSAVVWISRDVIYQTGEVFATGRVRFLDKLHVAIFLRPLDWMTQKICPTRAKGEYSEGWRQSLAREIAIENAVLDQIWNLNN